MITTGAHNLVISKYDVLTQDNKRQYPDKVFFYLQRNGKKDYKAKFKMLYYEIYPEYLTSEKVGEKTQYKGCDIALICVKLDDPTYLNKENEF